MTDLSLAQDFEEVGYDQWLALVDKVLKGADFDAKLVSRSDDDLSIAPLYTRDMAPGGDNGDNNDSPGAAPFMRGFRDAASIAQWDIRQTHGGADAKGVNKAILADLAGGVASITVQMSAPGQAGLPVEPAAMAAALHDVDLSICPITLQAGENFGAAAAYLLGNWAKQNIAPEARCGGFNADPLGTMAANGGLAQAPERAISSAAALVAKTQDLPQVTALLGDGRPYHNAGASEAQELALMLATVVAYLRGCETAGLSVVQSLPKIAIALAANTDQFMTIAKLRAARALVGRVAEVVDAMDAVPKMQLAVTTSARMMAKRDPWVNMLRTTIACAGAAMGGADAITILPFTAALGQPDDFARRIARNTQIILQEESGLGRVVDPAGGSWYVESATNDLAQKAWELFQQIEGRGGMAAALTEGFVQDMIAQTATARERQYAVGERAMTGVSAFAKLGDDDVRAAPFEPSPPVDRTGAQVQALGLRRPAAPFEWLRDAADAFAARTGRPPCVFLANLGPIGDFGARAAWAKNFVTTGGIKAIGNDGFTNAADVGAAFAASDADAACICSSDEVYGELGEAVASLLKTVGAKAVYLAGRGGDRESELRAAGVDEFLYARCDAVAALAAMHKVLGVDQ